MDGFGRRHVSVLPKVCMVGAVGMYRRIRRHVSALPKVRVVSVKGMYRF